MENMALAVPGQPALASEYNKVVGNVNELGRGTLFRRHDATAQGLATGWYKVRFRDAVRSSNYVNTNANGDEFTITKTGLYTVTSSIRLASNSNGGRGIRISLASDVNATFGGFLSPTATGLQVTVLASAEEVFSEGTVLSIWTYQDSGGTLNTAPLSSGQAVCVSIRYCGES